MNCPRPLGRLAASTLLLGLSLVHAATAPPAAANPSVVTFSYTGGAQSFTVPAGVTSLTVEAWGAQGGTGSASAVPGRGAYVRTTLGVTSGQNLGIWVGGQGGATPGFNGGGMGGTSAGRGGGASDVRAGSNRLVVAGGGGGAGANDGPQASSGGNGGAPFGADGNAGSGPLGASGGRGGTTSAGGAGGTGPGGNGTAGTAGSGGAGADDGGLGRGGGGGGGGLFGGGGGGAAGTGGGGGGGGGGSSYAAGTGTTFQAGVRVGNGQVVLTFTRLQCSDGLDNDADGRVDYPADYGCSSADDTTEAPDPQCGDGLDNDGDGRVDYPADAGCTGSRDTSEGVACTSTSGVITCVGLSAGDELQRLDVYEPEVGSGPTHRAAGFVDLFRFVLPGDVVVSLPCVVLVVEGSTVSPCAVAGGTATGRMLTLVDQVVAQPVPALGPLIATVGICEAELVATVNGVGVTSAPAYTLC